MAAYMIIFILIILLAAVGLRYALLCRELKDTERQLEEIVQDLEQNRILRQRTGLKELEPLLESMNSALKEMRRQHTAVRRREKQFQQQIAQISHDLRTPLTSMIGYLRLMDQSNFTEEEKEDIAVVERKAQALQRLITQFYDYARVQDGELKLRLEKVDAARLLREKILESWKDMEERGLETELALPDGAVFVSADQDALERIYANLIQNCGRYAKQKLQIGLQAKEGQTVIFFENDVSDLQPEEVEKLFERFYVRDSARTKGASGLGLSIARGLAEKMGGTLTAEIPEEGWLRFGLTLNSLSL